MYLTAVGWPASRPAGWLAGWLAGRLAGWLLAGWLAGWLATGSSEYMPIGRKNVNPGALAAYNHVDFESTYSQPSNLQTSYLQYSEKLTTCQIAIYNNRKTHNLTSCNLRTSSSAAWWPTRGRRI